MKTKPLKNKAFKLDSNASADEGVVFWFLDVKSAVHGLIEEIKGEIKDLNRRSNEAYIEGKKLPEYSRNLMQRALILIGIQIEQREILIKKIKKWFPDVMKDD